jgi:1-acyl-sn-glycerol-3-phosphate acyltransferase
MQYAFLTPPPAATRAGPLAVAYAAYAWALFLVLGVMALVAVLLPFSRHRRRAVVRRFARLILRLAGVRLRLAAPLEALPEHCIVIANHSSYVDGVVLAAALPPRFTFVIKREMAQVPLAGTLLRRMGAEFVERTQRQRAAVDARRLLQRADRGEALVFFPEGTFNRVDTGLLRFHIGAFAAAVRAGVPVVPVIIRNARGCLAPGSLLPRPVVLEVQVLPPLPVPLVRDADAASGLRDLAHAHMLAALQSPEPG